MPLVSPDIVLAELKQVVNQIPPSQRRKVQFQAIFDIDGTLIDNYPRQVAIYEEVLQSQFNLPPIRELSVPLTPYFLGDYVPGLQADRVKYHEVEEAFVTHFLSPDFLDFDKPFPGSVQFLDSVRQLGLGIIYLTSRLLRGSRSMVTKTVQQLGDWGFPVAPSTEVKFSYKGEASGDDLEYKRKFAELLAASKDQVCLFAADNETKMCVMFREAFPDAIVVRFESAQSQKLKFDGPTLATWEIK